MQKLLFPLLRYFDGGTNIVKSMNNRPFYNKLYADLIRDKYPEKRSVCAIYFRKKHWTALDVIAVNELLFGSHKKQGDRKIDKMHRSYDKESIRQILRHQQSNKLSNKELANQYGLSRNTVAKWRRLFVEECTQG